MILDRMRLFICDDNAGYRALSRIVLEEGHEVVGEAQDGLEAIELAPGAGPDVLLLDLNMPRLGGMAALPRLRALLPEVKIVILTTGRFPDEQRQAMEAGADGYIVKPESVFELPAELGRVLGG